MILIVPARARHSKVRGIPACRAAPQLSCLRSAELSGAHVRKRSGLASGTLYPILLRLESAGWFVSRRDGIDRVTAGRPRRRLYRLTTDGLARASGIFASFGRALPG